MRLRYKGDFPGLPEGVNTDDIEHSETCRAHRVPVEMTAEHDEELTATLQRLCVHPGDIVTMGDELAERHLSASLWEIVEDAPKGRAKAAPVVEAFTVASSTEEVKP